MSNTNCLTHMQCPQCESQGPFWIDGCASFLVTDNGTAAHENVEWQDDNDCVCAACRHRGTVTDFTLPPTAGSTEDRAPDLLEVLGNLCAQIEGVYGDIDLREAKAAIRAHTRARQPLKPYSVLLLYPDTGDDPDTYYAHTEAKNLDAAITSAQAEAEAANAGIQREDFLPLIVLPGHIEAELFYRDLPQC